MKNLKIFKFLFLFPFILVAILPAVGQTKTKQASVNISGEVEKQISLTTPEMDKLKNTELVAKNHAGKPQTYSGVALSTLLEEAGITFWPELTGKNLTKYVLITARDGYQVVFSLAEIDPEFSDRKIILASRKDGALLTGDEAPYQIIIEAEKRKPRFIRQVTAIEVKFGF